MTKRTTPKKPITIDDTIRAKLRQYRIVEREGRRPAIFLRNFNVKCADLARNTAPLVAVLKALFDGKELDDTP